MWSQAVCGAYKFLSEEGTRRMCFEYVFTTTAGIKAHSLHHCLAGGTQLTWRCWLREWAQGCDIYINCHAICLALGFFLLLKKHFDFDQNQVLYYASVPFSLPKMQKRKAKMCQCLPESLTEVVKSSRCLIQIRKCWQIKHKSCRKWQTPNEIDIKLLWGA